VYGLKSNVADGHGTKNVEPSVADGIAKLKASDNSELENGKMYGAHTQRTVQVRSFNTVD
jgi:hypothetical protein